MYINIVNLQFRYTVSYFWIPEYSKLKISPAHTATTTRKNTIIIHVRLFTITTQFFKRRGHVYDN